MYLTSDFVTNEQTENGFFELEGNDVALLILKSALLIEKKSVCPEMDFFVSINRQHKVLKITNCIMPYVNIYILSPF